ncbi:MAG: hypothetical protein GEV28_09400 [Actinophytocola sp.]|uniref:hypothetical protein n=1 Tax=Actinophytocola sp. TaxID=1872138 RepID=UPI00132BE76B|nr:hypothetical protein [Actinophytocola sp.]MPZ80590.1 hypothetical protein [Actinophytocola sp.]
MYVADGGVGAAPAAEPTFSGTQRLRIEPHAIPEALAAFREAHDRVARKVRELGSLPVRDWAGDPVSGETATQFTERTNGAGADSAMACLTGYQEQLHNAIESLKSAQADYLEIEGTNTARWGKY